MKLSFILVASGILGVLLLISWAGHPWSLSSKIEVPDIIHVEPESMVDSTEGLSVIKILTFNTSYFHGRGSEGPLYGPQNRNYYLDRLDRFALELKEWGSDVVCLQEIDFDSHRTHGIDEARYLAIKAGYPYVAQATSWEANYIPFPYFPISRQWGRMKSGGAILSRIPIKEHEVHLLAKPESQPWWYNIFYLHRYFQKVVLENDGKTFTLVNVHLEAFDKVDRKGQISKLGDFIKNHSPDFIAGDFNMTPTLAAKKSKFEDSTDDYENDGSFDLMNSFGMLEVIPQEIYASDESSYFTFPAWKPDRRLDYIFYRPGLKMMKAEVLLPGLGVNPISDHLPLRASFQIDSPKFNPYSL